MGNINFIFCNHPLHQHKVDDDYKEEYDIAKLNNDCALFRINNKGKLIWKQGSC